MAALPLVVAQLDDDAPPGRIGDWATVHGLDVRIVRPDQGESLPDPPEAGGIVVLGSDESVARPRVAWDPPLREWVARAVEDDVPVLGTCFGGQLLAAVLGGSVRLADDARSELGWFELGAAEAAAAGIAAGPWLGWHEDVIEAPPQSEVVVRNAFGVQAFRVGRHLGVQFHPEVTPAIVAHWASRTDGRRLAREGVDLAALDVRSAELAEPATAAAFALFDGWAAGGAVLPHPTAAGSREP